MSVLRIVVAVVCLVLSFAWPAHAGPSPAAAPPIPETLKPWIDWVAPTGFRCATGSGSKAICAWPGRLELEVDDKGGSFHLEARLDEGESLALPGSDVAWPFDVKVDDTTGVVLAGPRVSVSRGAHVITGRALLPWTWAALSIGAATVKPTPAPKPPEAT